MFLYHVYILCKNVPHPVYVILYCEYTQSETLRIKRMPCSEYIHNVPSDYFDNRVRMICSCRQGTSLDYKSLPCWEMRMCALYMYHPSLGQYLINLEAIFTPYAGFTCLSLRYAYTDVQVARCNFVNIQSGAFLYIPYPYKCLQKVTYQSWNGILILLKCYNHLHPPVTSLYVYNKLP